MAQDPRMAKSESELSAQASETLFAILDGGVRRFREDEDDAELLNPRELFELQVAMEKRAARKQSPPVMRNLL